MTCWLLAWKYIPTTMKHQRLFDYWWLGMLVLPPMVDNHKEILWHLVYLLTSIGRWIVTMGHQCVRHFCEHVLWSPMKPVIGHQFTIVNHGWSMLIPIQQQHHHHPWLPAVLKRTELNPNVPCPHRDSMTWRTRSPWRRRFSFGARSETGWLGMEFLVQRNGELIELINPSREMVSW